MPKPKQQKQKINSAQWIGLMGVIITIVLAIVLISASSTPLESAQEEKVRETLTEYGFELQDIAADYLKTHPYAGMKNYLTCNKENFEFNFYIFLNEKYAQEGYSNLSSQIDTKKLKYPNVQTGKARGNYAVRTLMVDDEYFYLMRIGNTLLFAVGNKENMNIINSIASDLGYVAD